EQSLLLAEQVLRRPGNDRAGNGAGETRLLHLFDGLGDALVLGPERRLERDERLARADRERRDRDALDDRVRVCAHEGTVLEGGGLTLGAVGDDEAMGAGGVQDRRPLAPGREAATDRKSTRLNSSHEWISYAVFCLKKKKICKTC